MAPPRSYHRDVAHGHGDGHDKGTPTGRAGARYAGRLRLAFVLAAAFLVVEAVTAFLAGSLALLSDAAHLLTDAVGIGMALAAIRLADRAGGDRSRTFGLYRLEILAALANAVFLFVVTGYVLVEAVLRLDSEASVEAGPMLVVAGLGLVVNVVSAVLLRSGARESLNVEGAYVDVLADSVASLGVIAAGLVIAVTSWEPVDAIVAIAIGVWIVPRAWGLAASALRILIQAAPAGFDVGRLETDLAAVPGVVDVHDLHVWTLTSEMDVASAHLMVTAGTDAHGVLDRARDVLRERYAIAHATLQVEPDDHTGCAEVEW
jgi:cobalt-zinc-cadmium efflux system protein